MVELIKTLVAPVSVSGRETAITNTLTELARKYGETRVDALGNLIVHKKGSGRRIMLAAHMDTVGLIVTYVDEDGYARFGTLGGLRPVPAIGQKVRFENGTVGIICAERGVKPEELTADKLYVDPLGQSVQVGDAAVCCGEPITAGDVIASACLDDRIGCAILLKTMELLGPTDNDLYFVFTAQEEVGARGAKTAAFSIMPELAFAVDVCGLFDTPGDFKPNGVTIDKPVICLMDGSVLCHPDAVACLQAAADKLAIPTQRLVTKRGGSDAGAIFSAGSGVPTGLLMVPTRYVHTPNEVASIQTAADCARILAEAISKQEA